ncbi:MAG: non-hydrolyzing UDP-N-acetylglucosamine 2-epimerase [Arsenophonus endosymbiont of Dermacentor nuttalli]
MKKFFTIIGARPQFIKANVVSNLLKKNKELIEIIIHTGQHFDANMSNIFFEQLGIPMPNYQLDINGGSHGQMTGRMLAEIEKILLQEKPDYVLVYGDTNSTLAGALAAAKLHIPVVHVEAGLRSFNMQMPEEINRILTDQISTLLFCPSQAAVNNLINEGINNKHSVNIFNVGDVMQDSALYFSQYSSAPNDFILDKYFILATLHRAENTDNPQNLTSIVNALNILHRDVVPVVLPMHPRTRNLINCLNLSLNVHIIEPVGYLQMLWLLNNAKIVLTDSGGVQKEAFFFQKYCITMRNETEWVELVENGFNILVGANLEKIICTVDKYLSLPAYAPINLYGNGRAGKEIVDILSNIP